MHLMELPTSPTRTKQLFELPEKYSAMRNTRKNTPDHKENDGMNRWLHHRRQEQKLVYFALFKVSSAKDKTKYIEESKQTAAKKTA